MKVLELHIENIRGIKKIDLKPEGNNFVIYGPNGTGKSAVVDALDFLFTGKISRLAGEGTSGITLGKHGCHIDSDPKETIVQAVVEVPDSEEKYELKRTIHNPGTLKIVKGDREKIREYLDIATRGHHVLARRDILRYVAAQRGERAKEIQALLNLEKIERVRQVLVSVETDKLRIFEGAQIQFNSTINDICHYLSIVPDEFSENIVIERINKLRSKLKGEAISVLEEKVIKQNLNPPSIPLKDKIVEPDFVKSNIEEIRKSIDKESKEIRLKEDRLIVSLRKLEIDKVLKKELQSYRLIELGISLLDETGKCPLCEKQWDPRELREKLNNRLVSAKEARQIQKGIDEIVPVLKIKYASLENNLSNIEKALEVFSLEREQQIIKKWIGDIDGYSRDLDDAENKIESLERYLKKPIFFVPKEFEEVEKIVLKKADTEGKKLTEEQISWDTLTKLEPLIRSYNNSKNAYKKAEIAFKRSQLLKVLYEESKDKVLNDLFGKIKDDFVEFYKFMHGKDEEKFDAEFLSKGAELIFEVDFYGRGRFPPIALHSEGHQDSMGVCLYLALMKLLSEEKMLLTVLDDVVMSIDSSHRRTFSQLLLKFFPERQFLITTHNRTWARQLQTDGIVQSKNMIEFQNWSVDTGPIFEEDIEMWSKINDFIEKNNISSAAHTLREGSEFYFDQVCEKIMASTRHKCDGRHELGDLLPPAIGRYRDLLKLAKKSANSWGNPEAVEKLSELESVTNEIVKRSQVEQWGINENVHYSKWGDFSPQDFKPIPEAFRDLFDVFRCVKCGSLLYITLENKELKNLRCNCQGVSWNMTLRK